MSALLARLIITSRGGHYTVGKYFSVTVAVRTDLIGAWGVGALAGFPLLLPLACLSALEAVHLVMEHV